MKNVLIIGASSGIGEALAKRMAKHGVNVALAARREDKLNVIADELHATGVQVEVATMDVTDAPSKLFATIKSVAEKLGKLDTVVINAGVINSRKLGTLDIQSDADIINTNVTGAIGAADAATKYFSEIGGGHIVVTSSVSAFIPLAESPVYAASKAAVTHYFEGIRGRLKKRSIEVTILHPGFIKTAMTEELANRLPSVAAHLLIADSDDAARHIMNAIKDKKTAAMIPPMPWAAVNRTYQLLPKFLKHKIG